MAWEYSEKTKQLFMDAVQGKPGTHLGEIPDPDGEGEHGSIVCGDAMRFTFKVKRHPTDPTKDVITQARYLTFGCTSAIASSEALCQMLEKGNYTPIEALKITNQDIVEYLGGLPHQKVHCSVMGTEALRAAVFNWAQRRGVDLRKLGVDITPEEQKHGRVVCKCFGLTEPYLRRKIKELNLRTIPDIIAATKAGGACGRCQYAPGGLQELLNEIWGASEETVRKSEQQKAQIGEAADTGKEELSPYQFAKKIERAVEEYVRPALRKDGGDIEIIDIKGTSVYCSLKGACAGCPQAGTTLKLMVEHILKDQVDERIRVIEV